jgi:hypothetical protein
MRALERGEDTSAAWRELWNELYHQGDVGEASYAAIPHLVRIYEANGAPDSNIYHMAAIIEHARRKDHNPDLPADFQKDYEAAWDRLVALGLRELTGTNDPTLISAIISVLAMQKGQHALGSFAAFFDESERVEMLADWL